MRVGLHWSRPAHLVCCYSNSTKSSRTSPSQHKPEQTHQKSWNGRKWSKNAWWSTPAGWGCTCEADWCTGSGQCSYSQLGGLDNKVYLSRILDVLLVLYVDACAETRKRCLLKAFSQRAKRHEWGELRISSDSGEHRLPAEPENKGFLKSPLRKEYIVAAGAVFMSVASLKNMRQILTKGTNTICNLEIPGKASERFLV